MRETSHFAARIKANATLFVESVPMPSTRQPNFALLLGLAWLLVVLQLLAQNWAETGQTLLDTDDAMRLAQLRAWLGGHGWYDLSEARVAFG